MKCAPYMYLSRDQCPDEPVQPRGSSGGELHIQRLTQCRSGPVADLFNAVLRPSGARQVRTGNVSLQEEDHGFTSQMPS